MKKINSFTAKNGHEWYVPDDGHIDLYELGDIYDVELIDPEEEDWGFIWLKGNLMLTPQSIKNNWWYLNDEQVKEIEDLYDKWWYDQITVKKFAEKLKEILDDKDFESDKVFECRDAVLYPVIWRIDKITGELMDWV